MKKSLLVLSPLLPMLFFASCEKEDPGIDPGTAEKLSASIDDNFADGNYSAWHDGESFAVLFNGKGGISTASFELEGEGGSGRRTFVSGTKIKSDPLISVYPSSMATGAVDASGPFVWPYSQRYSSETVLDIPRWSSTTDLGSTFSFKNLGGLLKVNVKGDGPVTAIKISAQEKLSGNFSLSFEGSNPLVSFNSSKSFNYITLECGGRVSLSSSGTDFYFSLPEGEYSGLTVEFLDNGQLVEKKSIEGKVAIERNRTSSVSVEGVSNMAPGMFLGVIMEWTVIPDDVVELLLTYAPEYDMPEIRSLLVTAFTQINVVSIEYATTGVDGSLVHASGIIGYQDLPDGGKYEKIVSFQHPSIDINLAPSNVKLTETMIPVSVSQTISGTNNIAVMEDHLGYGISQTPDLQHPYLHSKLTGSTCADMFSAAEEFIAERGFPVASAGSGAAIDLVGYSQGGAATISTLLEMVDRGLGSRINEVWAGAGPYDLMSFMDFFKEKINFPKPQYIPFSFRGLCYAEGASLDYTKVFNEKVHPETLEQMFSTTQASAWIDRLGNNMKDILHPDFYKENFGGNAEILKIVAKIKLYHSRNDDTVPYACSEALRDALGCSEIIDINASNHIMGAIEFLKLYCGITFF